MKKIKLGRWILLLLIFIAIYLVFWKLGIRRENVVIVTNETEIKDAYKKEYHLESSYFMITDGKTVEKRSYSGKQIWKVTRQHKNIVFGADAYYEYDNKGVIEKHEIENGELLWSTDFSSFIQYVKEDGDKLYIIIQNGQMSSIGLIVDPSSGTPKFDKQFNEEQIVKLGSIGEKHYAITLRLGNNDLYGNLYIMNENGEVEYQKNYEREILTKLDIIDKNSYLIYSDEYLRYISDGNEIWKYPLLESSIDYTFDDNENESIFIKNGRAGNTKAEKVSLKEQIVTELELEDEISELILLEDILLYRGKSGLYFIDSMNQVIRMYDFDSMVYKTEKYKSNILLVFKDRLQIVKKSRKWSRGGKDND